jgi:hypothetical protein
MHPALNDLAQLSNLVHPRTTVGCRKSIKFGEQQRHLPLIEDSIPIGIQGPQHREIQRVQRREEVRPLQSALSTGNELSEVPAYLHVDHPSTLTPWRQAGKTCAFVP